MKTYELVIVLEKSESGKGAKFTQELKETVEKLTGELIKTAELGVKTLSYLIKNQKEGFFVTSEITIPQAKIKELTENFKRNAKILRFLVLQKESYG